MTAAWQQLSLCAPPAEAALLEHLLDDCGALSVTLGEAGDRPIFEPPPGATPLWGLTRVTALFDGDTDLAPITAGLCARLAPELAATLTIELLADRAWEREWLDRFGPMRFGERLWICPTGFAVDAADACVVRLDPGLAFGTGTHPTTALCLEWLDAHPPRGERVIDFGCGSGILAIAALRLGADRVVAIDHDPQALEATAANARRNGVADRLEVVLPDALPTPAADRLVANILAAPLLELAPRLRELLRPGGRLALSGILDEQAAALRDRYAPLFELGAIRRREEWVLLEGRARRC